MSIAIQKIVRLILVIAWLAAIAGGARVLLVYENTAAQAAQAPERWPSHTPLLRRDNRFTLVLLAHPDCPCTRASLAELEIAMSQLEGRLAAFVIFTKTGASAEQIAESGLWRKAASIPGVSVFYDAGGRETDRFGGQASGQTMLYNREGALVFSGGITRTRGHQGENEGVDTLVRLVTGGEGDKVLHTSVYGCDLHDPSAQALKEDPSWKK